MQASPNPATLERVASVAAGLQHAALVSKASHSPKSPTPVHKQTAAAKVAVSTSSSKQSVTQAKPAAAGKTVRGKGSTDCC